MGNEQPIPGQRPGPPTAGERTAAPAVWRTLAVVALLAVGAAALSLRLNWSAADRASEELALVTARAFFRSVLAARAWNALHGGVYVPVTEDFPPNPYLEDPLRDVTTTEGLRLTKVNPAYMTRLLAGVVGEHSGLQVHITSLRPLRPGNAPNPWEETALARFEAGETEIWALLPQGEAEQELRYMAPLLTEKPCLGCHGRHRFQVGDVRGGISVGVPFGPFRAAARAQQTRLVAAHGGFVALGLGITALLGVRLTRSLRALDRSRRRERTLEGLLPICMHCKKIRAEGAPEGDPVSWSPVETYIQARSEAHFSHGLCPTCLEAFYPEQAASMRARDASR